MTIQYDEMPDFEWDFPSPLAAIREQQASRYASRAIHSLREYYAKHDPSIFAATAIPQMSYARLHSRLAREHLFGLIGDGTLEDCPPTWMW